MDTMINDLRQRAQGYTKVIVGMARAEDQREWNIADRIETLETALRDGLELFDNYGFADESPCARDREIVANMRAALGERQK